MASRLSRRRKLVFALAAMAIAVVGVLVTLLAVDVYVHRKYMASAGLNIWGYRGPTVGRKRPNESRIAVVGGSMAFGFGVHVGETFAAQLERLLNQAQTGVAPARTVSVVNLAYNNEGAHSLRYTLADYEALDYDVVVFYTGENDIAYTNNYQATNFEVFRHTSAVFRATGYFPMLPLVLREKAMMIRYDGRLEEAYLSKPTVFRPNLTQRSAATTLEAVANLSDALDRNLAEQRVAPEKRALALADPEAVACAQFTGFCDELYLAVKAVLDRGRTAVVVSQPPISELHREQQFLMKEYLKDRFAGQNRLRILDLGLEFDRTDPTLVIDGSHLTAAGNLTVAQRMLPEVRAAILGEPVPPARPRSDVEPDGMEPPRPSSRSRDAAVPAPGTTRVSPIDERRMAWIPTGEFVMGSPLSAPHHRADETPHPVRIASGFWMDTDEVTNAAYAKFLGVETIWTMSRLPSSAYFGLYLRDWFPSGHPPQDRLNDPLSSVTWGAAASYCQWAGKRLPTEREWEYAAKAGSTTAYWWGDTFDPQRANRNGTGPVPVGQAQHTNPWGLTDIIGNVAEWTSSSYPNDAGTSFDRLVVKGGSWFGNESHLRPADRFKYNARVSSIYVGFRCVQ